MEKEVNYFKIGFYILIILIIMVAGYWISRFYISEAFIEGINQGRNEVIIMNTNNRFLIYNTQINQTQEWNLGNLCNLPGVR